MDSKLQRLVSQPPWDSAPAPRMSDWLEHLGGACDIPTADGWQWMFPVCRTPINEEAALAGV